MGLESAPHEERLGEEEEQLVRRREVRAHSTYKGKKEILEGGGSNAVATAEEG